MDKRYEHFAEYLRNLRQAAQLTQSELARLCKLSVKQYRRLERGEQEPRPQTRRRILDALRNLTPNLLSDDGRIFTVWERPTLLSCYDLGVKMTSTQLPCVHGVMWFVLVIKSTDEDHEISEKMPYCDDLEKLTAREQEEIETARRNHWPSYPEVSKQLQLVADAHAARLMIEWYEILQSVEDKYWFPSFVRSECRYLRIKCQEQLWKAFAALNRETARADFQLEDLVLSGLSKSIKRISTNISDIYGTRYGLAYVMGYFLGTVIELLSRAIFDSIIANSFDQDVTRSVQMIEDALQQWHSLAELSPVFGVDPRRLELELPEATSFESLLEWYVNGDIFTARINKYLADISHWDDALRETLSISEVVE